MTQFQLILFLMTVLCSCHQKDNKKTIENISETLVVIDSKKEVVSNQRTCSLRFKVTTYMEEQEVDVMLEIFTLKFKSEILLAINSKPDTSNLINDIPLELKSHLLRCCEERDTTKKYSFVVSCGSGCAMRYDEQ